MAVASDGRRCRDRELSVLIYAVAARRAANAAGGQLAQVLTDDQQSWLAAHKPQRTQRRRSA
jgi:hypothetical protein